MGAQKFLKIFCFEGPYFHFFILLYKLLREWPLNLIVLATYITGNSI